ncbi:MAG: hypothetical protein ACYC1M_14190 [Armatimonadota bacterium]
MTSKEMPFGRFTAVGGVEVERLVTSAAKDVGGVVSNAIGPQEMRCLIMLGGYGRGEGGVETQPDGNEVPHNNLDFLLICNNLSELRLTELKERIDAGLQPLIELYGLGMDLSTINTAKLEGSECLVMWYDMRYGHKTILGDAGYVPGLHQFSLDRVVPADARNLLTNRGTLFIINDAILDRGGLSDDDRRTIVKHVVKGVIGYGDALLFFLNDYDWSYLEKQRRMIARKDVDPGFQKLYDDCMEFRFRPNYAPYMERDLVAWMNEIRKALAPVHLMVERIRLKSFEMSWDGYCDRALAHTLREGLSLKGLVKKVMNMCKTKTIGFGSIAARLGFCTAGVRGLMPIIFPAVAYHVSSVTLARAAQIALGALSTKQTDLRQAYLRAWGIHGDTNFAAVLRKLRLHL